MSTGAEDLESPHPDARRHPLVRVFAGILFAECALLVVATIYLVIEIFIATPASVASAIALTLLTALGAVWLGFIATNVLRGRAWVRGATVSGRCCRSP